MKFKHFLKPDKRKIAVFVIFIILSFIFPLIPIEVIYLTQNLKYISGKLPPSPLITFMTIPGFYVYWYGWYGTEYIVNSIFLIIMLIFYYLFSCLIIWFYDKTRGKNK